MFILIYTSNVISVNVNNTEACWAVGYKGLMTLNLPLMKFEIVCLND